jgi:hypothetical protein
MLTETEEGVKHVARVASHDAWGVRARGSGVRTASIDNPTTGEFDDGSRLGGGGAAVNCG